MKATRLIGVVAALVVAASSTPNAAGADLTQLQQRRARAMAAFPDGILILRARRSPAWNEDAFRQDQAFFYFTGLENTLGAVLALDGRTRKALLFLPDREPGLIGQRTPEAALGQERMLGIDRIRPLRDLEALFTTPQRARRKPVLYVMAEWAVAEVPLPAGGSGAVPPLFARVLGQKHGLRVALANAKVDAIMSVLGPSEQTDARAAGVASSAALRAGMRAAAAGVTQRRAEGAVVKACLDAGARQSFWPWVMAGPNSDFPRPFMALARYDHLDRVMAAGELVRLDVGCEVGHHEGDVGRTIPVSGRFDPAQREVWTAFVAAYRAGAAALRPGATGDSVFAAWREELLRHAATVKSDLARRAIERWSHREALPFWQIHTTGLTIVDAPVLQEGMVVAFEPIASIDGSGYFMEDTYLITRDGAEILTPGLPTTAEEIEAAMRR